MHHVHHQRDAEAVELGHPLVGVVPVERAGRGLQHVPGEGVPHRGDAGLLLGPPQVVPPELVVLGPGELVDLHVGQERALHARAPDELLDGQGGHGRVEGLGRVDRRRVDRRRVDRRVAGGGDAGHRRRGCAAGRKHARTHNLPRVVVDPNRELPVPPRGGRPSSWYKPCEARLPHESQARCHLPVAGQGSPPAGTAGRPTRHREPNCFRRLSMYRVQARPWSDPPGPPRFAGRPRRPAPRRRRRAGWPRKTGGPFRFASGSLGDAAS